MNTDQLMCKLVNDTSQFDESGVIVYAEASDVARFMALFSPGFVRIEGEEKYMCRTSLLDKNWTID